MTTGSEAQRSSFKEIGNSQRFLILLLLKSIIAPPLFFWHICAREYSLIFSYNVLKGVRRLDAATFAQRKVGN